MFYWALCDTFETQTEDRDLLIRSSMQGAPYGVGERNRGDNFDKITGEKREHTSDECRPKSGVGRQHEPCDPAQI